MAGVFDDIKMMLRRGDSLTWLIAVNCVAFVVVHRGQPFAAKELALIYLLMFLIFFRMGAGGYSLDSVIARRMYIAEL